MLWDGQGRPDLNTTDMVCCDQKMLFNKDIPEILTPIRHDVDGWELLLLKEIL